jgi:pimeloyl-ACP methyl ester carboxylesterase
MMTGYQDLAAPPPTRRVEAHSNDGTRLNVEVFGPAHAPTVLLVHGWTCSIAFWGAQINDLLAAGYRVAAYDQRGHGGSAAPGPAGYSPAALADDLSAVLDEVAREGRKVVVAGHSMGSMTLVAFGARHPDQLRRQVAAALITSTGMHELFLRSKIVPMPVPIAKLARPISRAVMSFSPPGGRVTAVDRWTTKYAMLSRQATRAEVDFCARIVAACPPRTRAGFARMLSELDLDAQVRELAVPTMVIAGRKDRLTPIWHARRLAATLPRLITFTELPGVGHMVPVQSAAETNAALRGLVADHLPAARGIDVRDPAAAKEEVA